VSDTLIDGTRAVLEIESPDGRLQTVTLVLEDDEWHLVRMD